jgi:hypothetical protein
MRSTLAFIRYGGLLPVAGFIASTVMILIGWTVLLPRDPVFSSVSLVIACLAAISSAYSIVRWARARRSRHESSA